MRLSDLVACDCRTLITFSNNFAPDQARQIAAYVCRIQILLLLLLLFISVNLAWAVSNSIEKNAKFCYAFLA